MNPFLFLILLPCLYLAYLLISWLFTPQPPDIVRDPSEKWLQQYRYRDDLWRQCFDGPLDNCWVPPGSHHLNQQYDLVEDYYSSRLYYTWKGRS